MDRLGVFIWLLVLLPIAARWVVRVSGHRGAWASVLAGAGGGALASLVLVASFLWDALHGAQLGMLGLALPAFLIAGAGAGAVVGILGFALDAIRRR